MAYDWKTARKSSGNFVGRIRRPCVVTEVDWIRREISRIASRSSLVALGEFVSRKGLGSGAIGDNRGIL